MDLGVRDRGYLVFGGTAGKGRITETATAPLERVTQP